MRKTFPVHHIGFLDFTLFPEYPEFFSTYQTLNIKNHHLYSSKFSLSVINLTKTELATDEDRSFGVDYWARLFKANTWEEIKMLAENNEYLESAANSLYEAYADRMVRERCRACREAERYERTLERDNKLLREANASLEERNSNLKERNSSLEERIKNWKINLPKQINKNSKKPMSKLTRALNLHSILICVFVSLSNEYCSLSSHFIACKIFIVSCNLVNHASVWKDFDDTICCCLNDLMVT